MGRLDHERSYSAAEGGSPGCSFSMEANTLTKTQYPLEKLEIINRPSVSAFNQPNIKLKKSSPCVHHTK